MKLMALDCEYNQPTEKTIQIGAVFFDTKSFEVEDTFVTYVNPGEIIDSEITKLTRITNEHVSFAPTIGVAYAQLKKFHDFHQAFTNPIVWGSGEYNDSSRIWRESGEKENFMGYRVIDVKTLAQARSIATKGNVQGGLSAYLQRVGLDWDSRYGAPHDALADAFNTMRIFQFYHDIIGMYASFEPTCKSLDNPKSSCEGALEKTRRDISLTIEHLGRLNQIEKILFSRRK